MSYEWLDALQWSGNRSLESGREEEGEEEKRTNCYELINDKIFVYRCNTCLLVFTCVHSFSNHVLNENHQIKQLNSLKKGKYFNCLRCKYVCLSIAKIINHIELYNHCHNILRKIKRNMIYNGIASCSCKVKCYTFYSQNKHCLTTGDPILAEYEGVPNFQPIDEGAMCSYDQSDSHEDGDMEFFPKRAEIPPKKNNLLLMTPPNVPIPHSSSADVCGDSPGDKSLRRKTLGFILNTTGQTTSNATDARHPSPAHMNIAPMPCNQVGEQTELSPICTDINKINDFNAVLLNLEKQEKEKKRGVKNEENSYTTDATRNLLLHIYENNYHLNRINKNNSFHHDTNHNEKKCDILEETQGQFFSSPSASNNGNNFSAKNYDPLRSYRYNDYEQGAFNLFSEEQNIRVGTRGGYIPYLTPQWGHPQNGSNIPDRKDKIETTTSHSAFHESTPSYITGGKNTRNKSTQNRPPNYNPIFEDHHNLDQYLSSEHGNKIDLNMEGEMEEIKSSFLHSIQNSAKKLAELDTLHMYEKTEDASFFCSDPSSAYRNIKEIHTNVVDQMDTHPNDTTSGMNYVDEEQMEDSIKGEKISPSEEDFKKYFCKNFLSHIFDYQPRSMISPMDGAHSTDSGEPSNGETANVMEDTYWDARHDMNLVNDNRTHNVARRKTPNREPFTEMAYPHREEATDAPLYLTQRIDDSSSFLSPKYWQPNMDEMERIHYGHMDGESSREVNRAKVGTTNQLSYMKYIVGGGEPGKDFRTTNPFPLVDSSLTYVNKKSNENFTEEREKKKQLDLLTLYCLQEGGFPYTYSDVKNEDNNGYVQNKDDKQISSQLNKNSHHFNLPYEDSILYGKCFNGWEAEEENDKEENRLHRNDGAPSFIAAAMGAYRGLGNTNTQKDAPQQIVVTKGMNQWNASANQLTTYPSNGENINIRHLSLPSRDKTESNPTNNTSSRTQEQILKNIFEDSSDDKQNIRTPSETAALNKKRQSFIDEVSEIKKLIEEENKNNNQPNLTHMNLTHGQRMEPAIPFHGERSNFSKIGDTKKQNFYLGNRNKDDRGAYPNFKSIRTNDSRGEGTHWGIPPERVNFGSGHFHNGYFQSSRIDKDLQNHRDNPLDSRRDHFSRGHQQRKKSTDDEKDHRFTSNLSKWQSRR
ncbi:conserved Plasmodium protein, unknown function [Plasmodium knowlesi strain H]|uniref:C2H2-type domain-containing protein n=3 Tax=Plasmodium knowlesi TaxID=5850 RepID=A0A5K1TZN0_PLAKH|nr:conserved Plasmodium protein, unknown function [Plasmodium knowlesi strain H]OTN68466.1 Uncharacterized protein PKNOH_S02297900 [Plasmodium knowlesi]CAA9986484.1 conserved Plasmodium protein, unknown function [Plasmodium knowlesi strain H]SBO24261.1 conserved Plasmodium protein, unknown function [Plasmodium knowlesi strain H]SBO29731.1 conserved Plasmodium protein, unknown function [Plasmodium knowlesi strain H]VVS75958.1 conserved Plasmodium protein, unknown function [Plasmodium knowlesi s|eukprot:XP_002261035.1 hypothetical protein, conserved in Plasmodium species [Plasmodium knowlesi strain H]